MTTTTMTTTYDQDAALALAASAIAEKYGVLADVQRFTQDSYSGSTAWTLSRVTDFSALMSAMGIVDAQERAVLSLIYQGHRYALSFDAHGSPLGLCQHASLEWRSVDDPSITCLMSEDEQESLLAPLEEAWDDLCERIADEFTRASLAARFVS